MKQKGILMVLWKNKGPLLAGYDAEKVRMSPVDIRNIMCSGIRELIYLFGR